VLNQLRRMLALHALDEVDNVQERLRSLDVGRYAAPLALTEASLALTRVSLQERCRWIERQLSAPKRWIWGTEELEELRKRVDAACGGSGMLRWHEHYNAACAFALPLLVEGTEEPEIRDELATLAVKHLERATSCADSGYIATRRDWLLSEDPDLAGLRTHTKFKAFEAMYFPAPAPVPRRPRQIQPLEVSTYTRDLLDATARRWEAEWHARRDSPDLDDPHTLVRWWQDEARAWKLVGRTAWNYRRWRVRYDLLKEMDDLSLRYGGGPLDVAFRPFEAPWMCVGSEQAVDDLAKKALEEAAKQYGALAGALCETRPADGEFGMKGIGNWVESLRDKEADGKRVRAEAVTALCDRHAAVWEGLHLWLVEGGSADGSAAERFHTQRGKLSKQLRSAA
jgi:hypothetical protein